MAPDSSAGASPDPATGQPEEPFFHRDRREHGGAPQRLDDYDPDDVPPATDTPPQPEDIRQSDQYVEERAEIRREYDKDELRVRGQRDPFPPTHYDR